MIALVVLHQPRHSIRYLFIHLRLSLDTFHDTSRLFDFLLVHLLVDPPYHHGLIFPVFIEFLLFQLFFPLYQSHSLIFLLVIE